MRKHKKPTEFVDGELAKVRFEARWKGRFSQKPAFSGVVVEHRGGPGQLFMNISLNIFVIVFRISSGAISI